MYQDLHLGAGQRFGQSIPEVQESDCLSAQRASPVPGKQVCHAHQLRDLLYAQDHGDEAYAPRMSRLIRMEIHLAHRRGAFRPSLFAHQAERLKRVGHRLGFRGPVANQPPAGSGYRKDQVPSALRKGIPSSVSCPSYGPGSLTR
jgi:hypothetical protein